MLAKYLENEENTIRKSILSMGQKACKAVEKSIHCYINTDCSIVEEMVANDVLINDLEREIEFNCIKLIARQQPVAHDLRELLADMNIAKELERVADYAVSISKIVQKMPVNNEAIDPKILNMSEIALAMLTEVLINYAEKDATKAHIVALKDDLLDDLENELNDKIFKKIQVNPENCIYYTYQLWIIHQFERMGDRVTNIAESVIFQSTGKVVNFD